MIKLTKIRIFPNCQSPKAKFKRKLEFLLSENQGHTKIHFLDKKPPNLSENLGAVRELAMNAGDLGVRVDDLEKANESVAVRLSKLRRGGSVKSTASSFNSDPDDFKVENI